MRIESLDDEQVRTLVGTARDVGVSVFDHADIYGSRAHACERRFGAAVEFGFARANESSRSASGVRRADAAFELGLTSLIAGLTGARTRT